MSKFENNDYYALVRKGTECISNCNNLLIASRYRNEKIKDLKETNGLDVCGPQKYYHVYKCSTPTLWIEINNFVCDLQNKIKDPDNNELCLKTYIDTNYLFYYILCVIDKNIKTKIESNYKSHKKINILDVDKDNNYLNKDFINVYINYDNMFDALKNTHINYISYMVNMLKNLKKHNIEKDNYSNPIKIKIILINLAIYIYQELSIDINSLVEQLSEDIAFKNYLLDAGKLENNNLTICSKINDLNIQLSNNKKSLMDKIKTLINTIEKFVKIINSESYEDNEFITDIIVCINNAVKSLKID